MKPDCEYIVKVPVTPYTLGAKCMTAEEFSAYKISQNEMIAESAPLVFYPLIIGLMCLLILYAYRFFRHYSEIKKHD